eukprot:GHVU01012760.1.p2 GENE.GHVU01012760.1~~GHVU01012760.1.p2  ORF type:complete len:154 (+),score=21.02 GHVU01012760.1:596-1057(+)
MLFVLHPCCKETWTEDAGRARRRRVQLRGGAARLIGTIGVPPQVHQTARLQTKPHVVGSCDSIFKAHEDRLDETKFCESIEGDKELVSESGSEAVREGGREGERERGAIRFAGRTEPGGLAQAFVARLRGTPSKKPIEMVWGGRRMSFTACQS